MNKALAMNCVARIPIIGTALRRLARVYREGSVVEIRAGYLAGYRWRRGHQYVSGYWLGTYELPVQECLIHELKQGDIFYDVGANAGFFSLLAARRVGGRGHVFAFEPLPANIETLREQFALNQCGNSEIVELAVSDRAGEVTLYEGGDRSTACLDEVSTGSVRRHPVHAVTLDEFIETHAHPDFIKVDIEGAEVSLLRGATRLLSGPCRPRLLIEFHSRELAQAGCDILKSHGYYLFDLYGRTVQTNHRSGVHILAVPFEP